MVISATADIISFRNYGYDTVFDWQQST